MPQLTLTATTVPGPAGAIVRVTDRTDWSQAASPREAWALFLAASRVGSVQSQDGVLAPLSYNAYNFQSGGTDAGTVEVPVEVDGVLRLQALAVPVLADAAGLAAAPAGLYYQLDFDQFYAKSSIGLITLVSTWSDVLALGEPDGATEAYAFNDYRLQSALALLNLRYLEAGPRTRSTLVPQYVDADLLVEGAACQFERGFYADAATTVLAAERLVSACLPDFATSLPALPAR